MTTPTPLKALSSGPSHLAVRRHIFVSLTFCVSVHGEIACSAAAAKLLQSCPTLCDSRDGSPRGSPWDSPGKNTGVSCHFLLQCMKAKSESEVAQSCRTPSDPTDCSLTRLLRPWDFPGKSTGVGCHCLLRTPVLVCGFANL